MHTVFINDQPLRLISAYDQKEIELAKGHILFSEKDKRMDELISDLENSAQRMEIFYLAENADSAWKIFISYCTLIEAAGGLVRNSKGEYLMILRHYKWD